MHIGTNLNRFQHAFGPHWPNVESDYRGLKLSVELELTISTIVMLLKVNSHLVFCSSVETKKIFK